MSQLQAEKLSSEGVDTHGYARCGRCGTKRPRAALEALDVATGDGSLRRIFVCDDKAFCSRAAGVGKGEIDGTGA